MILITGANGQIGADLITALVGQIGEEHIVASDLHITNSHIPPGVRFEQIDVRDSRKLDELLDGHAIDSIYHLAGILSATGEQKPDLCWDVNIGGLRNVLEAARVRQLRIFWPSSIAVFGPKTKKFDAPQTAITDPATMYGITKVTGEQLCKYYARRHGIDVRSLRFPGVISYSAPPGGGTTDYAVDMFIQAVEHGSYDCFVTEETRLPMMYMPDAVKSILDLMNANNDGISVRTSYNVTAFNFSAGELADAIRKHRPDFICTFHPDFRQEIAETWPRSIDDSVARRDWNWAPQFDLEGMVQDMLTHVGQSSGKFIPVADSK